MTTCNTRYHHQIYLSMVTVSSERTTHYIRFHLQTRGEEAIFTRTSPEMKLGQKNKNFVSCNGPAQNLDPRPGIIFFLPINFFPDSQNFYGFLFIKWVFGLLNNDPLCSLIHFDILWWIYRHCLAIFSKMTQILITFLFMVRF